MRAISVPRSAVAVERGRRLLQAHLEVLDVPAMQVAVTRGDEFPWSEAFGRIASVGLHPGLLELRVAAFQAPRGTR